MRSYLKKAYRHSAEDSKGRRRFCRENILLFEDDLTFERSSGVATFCSASGMIARSPLALNQYANVLRRDKGG